MGKKKQNKANEADKELQARVQYPIGLLFQISTLIGCLSFMLMILSGSTDVVHAMFRAFVVFVGIAFIGGFMMMIVVSILHDIKMKEFKEKLRILEEEQIAQLEAQELELQKHEEARLEKIQQQKMTLSGNAYEPINLVQPSSEINLVEDNN